MSLKQVQLSFLLNLDYLTAGEYFKNKLLLVILSSSNSLMKLLMHV